MSLPPLIALLLPVLFHLIPFLLSLSYVLLCCSRTNVQKIVKKSNQGFLQLRNKNVIDIAASAVAAQLLRAWRTSHSTFNGLINSIEFDSFNVLAERQLATNVQNVDLFIWNEVLMFPPNCVGHVDSRIEDVAKSGRVLGGKVVLYFDDFLQVLSVIKSGWCSQIVHACVKISSLYRKFRTFQLTKHMPLTALRNDSKVEVDPLSFPNFPLASGGNRYHLIKSSQSHSLLELSFSPRSVVSVQLSLTASRSAT